MFYQINSLCLNNFIHSSCLYSVMAHQESLSSTTIPAVWINQNILTQLLVLLTELNFICNNNTLLYFSTQNNQPFEPAGLSVNLTDIVLQAFFYEKTRFKLFKTKDINSISRQSAADLTSILHLCLPLINYAGHSLTRHMYIIPKTQPKL